MVNTNNFQCFCFWGSFGLENNNVSHFQHKKCIPTHDNYIFLLGELTQFPQRFLPLLNLSEKLSPPPFLPTEISKSAYTPRPSPPLCAVPPLIYNIQVSPHQKYSTYVKLGRNQPNATNTHKQKQEANLYFKYTNKHIQFSIIYIYPLNFRKQLTKEWETLFNSNRKCLPLTFLHIAYSKNRMEAYEDATLLRGSKKT